MKLLGGFLALLALASIPAPLGAGGRCPAPPPHWMYHVAPDDPHKAPQTANEWKQVHRGIA